MRDCSDLMGTSGGRRTMFQMTSKVRKIRMSIGPETYRLLVPYLSRCYGNPSPSASNNNFSILENREEYIIFSSRDPLFVWIMP